MNRDKKVSFAFACILLVILSLSFLFANKLLKVFLSVILLVFTILLAYYVRKRKVLSINKKQVLMIVSIAAFVFMMGYYLLGIKYAYFKSNFPFNFANLFCYLIPSIILIVSFEFIRYIFISQENKLINILTYISSVLLEVIIIAISIKVTDFNKFMDLVGLAILPAIISNVVYQNLCLNYGMYPNIAYRLITSLYLYFIPVVPNVPDSMFALFKLFFPLILLMFIMILFGEKKKIAIEKKKATNVAMLLSLVVMLCITVLMSGQFKYAAIVIATDSMTGSINQGDIVVYEQYRNYEIKEEEIIVFKDGESLIVHRVVEIMDVDGEIRYITKGDYNDDVDAGYRLKSDIVGISKMKVPYFGYFTLWLREIFEK